MSDPQQMGTPLQQMSAPQRAASQRVSIQTTVNETFAAQLELLATARGQSVAAYVRDVLAGSMETAGTFFGVSMRRTGAQEEGPWFSHAVSYPHVTVQDGALVFQSVAGRTECVIAPGRWRECSRRIERDRMLFTGDVVYPEHEAGGSVPGIDNLTV